MVFNLMLFQKLQNPAIPQFIHCFIHSKQLQRSSGCAGDAAVAILNNKMKRFHLFRGESCLRILQQMRGQLLRCAENELKLQRESGAADDLITGWAELLPENVRFRILFCVGSVIFRVACSVHREAAAGDKRSLVDQKRMKGILDKQL